MPRGQMGLPSETGKPRAPGLLGKPKLLSMGFYAAVQEAQLGPEVSGHNSNGFLHVFSSFLTFAPSLLNLFSPPSFLSLELYSLMGQQRSQPCLRAEPSRTGSCSGEPSSPQCLQRHLAGKAAPGQRCSGEPLVQWVLQPCPAATPYPCLDLLVLLHHTWPPEAITDHRKTALRAPQPLPPLLVWLWGFALIHQGKGRRGPEGKQVDLACVRLTWGRRHSLLTALLGLPSACLCGFPLGQRAVVL